MPDFGAIGINIVELSAPVLIAVAISTAVCWLLARFLSTRPAAPDFLLLAGFGFLGGIVGAIAGSSQEAVVGGLMTGILGIVTAAMSYAYGKDSVGSLTPLIPLMIFALLLNTLTGLATGKSWRKKWDSYAVELADYRAEYDQVIMPTTRAMRQKLFDLCVAEQKTYANVRKNCDYAATEPAAAEPGKDGAS